jgi:hypothetical protein
MTRETYQLGIALSLGILTIGCSQKQPIVSESTPNIKPDIPTVPSTRPTADPYELKEIPASLTIYVPTKHWKLRRRVVKGKLYNAMPTAPSTYASVVAEKSLPLLFSEAQSSFPKGTKLTQFPKIEKGEDVIQVNLSKQFSNPGFWHDNKKTFAAVYAIVNTAVAGYPLPDSTLRVQILVEGKPIRNLANIDMRKPLRPRFEVVVNRKAA